MAYVTDQYESTFYGMPSDLTLNQDNEDNSRLNVTAALYPDFPNAVGTIVIAVVLGIFILLTFLGNIFVIYAISTEKNLKGPANYLICSLAVADLLVALLVLPFSALNEVYNQVWILGPNMCRLWTSLDVLCCTSSILHLLAIAVDRYWAVTNIEYARSRDKVKITLLMLAVWTGAFVISFAPVFGWQDPEFYQRLEEGRCLVSQNVYYQVFATFSSFYIPVICILLLYWNIFKQARKRIRSKPGASAVLIEKSNSSAHCTVSPPSNEASEGNDLGQTQVSENGVNTNQAGLGRLIVLAKREKKLSKESTEAKREKKAAKTLMIITGAFVCCWSPFFIMALLMAIFEWAIPNDVVFSLLLWLGYTNSLINPIIYTVFSPDFRNAFDRILCGAYYTSQRH